MIELYRITNLDKPYAKVPLTSGNITAERNGAYGLSFSILQSYLQKQNIVLDHNTIFKIDGLFYVSGDTSNGDTEKIERSINAELLQTQMLMFKWIDNLDLPSTTLSNALGQLLGDTIFSVGYCEDVGSFDFKVEKNNAQYALSELLKQTDTEVVYEGLIVSLRASNWDDHPIVLKKGYDFTTLQESTDVSDVITRLYFKNTAGDLSGIVDSAYINTYGFIREGYQEFEGIDMSTVQAKATEYLGTVDQPRCSIAISIPKVRKLFLSISQTVKIHNTLLNEEMVYKVVGYSKSLTKAPDTYQLGERKKDFTDIQQIISQEVQDVAPDIIIEVIEQEVLSARTAHILNAWIRDLNVEFLETNFEALDARKDYPEGGIRNFIRIKEEQIEFVTQTLSQTEFMDYRNKDGDQIYYTAIDTHSQAYKYFTLTEPTAIYDKLTPIQVEAFKVKVRKILTENIKSTFAFGTTAHTQYPIMTWGVGTDTSGTSDKGKGFIFKDLEGLILRYVTSSGVIHEIKLGENGIEGIPTGQITEIIQNINMGGLIEVPGQALTKADFYANGIRFEHGETQTTFTWTKDAAGRITTLKNTQANLTIPVSWNTSSL